MDLKEELIRVTDALREMRIEYAICGGIAVLIHGCPRPTYDLDFIVSVDDLAGIRTVLRPLGYILRTDIITFQAGEPTESKLWRVSKIDGEDMLTLDFLLLTPFLKDVWAGRRQFEFDGKTVTVVDLDGLRKMKVAAGRPKDLLDLENLKQLDD